MSAQRWKRQERAIAAALGAKRIPNNGAGQPGIRTPGGWVVQVKTRKEIPAWLWAAVDQARRDAGPGKRARRLVVLESDAWAADIGDETG